MCALLGPEMTIVWVRPWIALGWVTNFSRLLGWVGVGSVRVHITFTNLR